MHIERGRKMKNGKRWRAFLFIFLLLFIGACAVREDKPAYTLPLQIELTIKPDTLHTGQKALIQAVVTQGSEKVKDASEAIFEIGKKGDKNYETLEAVSKGNGIYAVEKAFASAGTYTIKAKVTAQDLTAVSVQTVKIREE
jgi:hypothetical protein